MTFIVSQSPKVSTEELARSCAGKYVAANDWELRGIWMDLVLQLSGTQEIRFDNLSANICVGTLLKGSQSHGDEVVQFIAGDSVVGIQLVCSKV